MKRRYLALASFVSIWIASLVLVIFPLSGFDGQIYPPPPLNYYKLLFLIATTIATSFCSMYIGLRHLFIAEN